MTLLSVIMICCTQYGSVNHNNKRIIHPISWALTCGFNEHEVNIIREGFLYWEQLAERQLFDELACVKIGNGIFGVLVSKIEYEYDILGYFATGTVEWTGEIGLASVERQVIRHEVGHLLGFSHTNNESGCIMNEVAMSDEACGAEIDIITKLYREKQ